MHLCKVITMTRVPVETCPRSSSADPVNNPQQQEGAQVPEGQMDWESQFCHGGQACVSRHPSGATACGLVIFPFTSLKRVLHRHGVYVKSVDPTR